jgi:hypothetical protein
MRVTQRDDAERQGQNDVVRDSPAPAFLSITG